MKDPSVLRYVFWAFWFVAVPAVLAFLCVYGFAAPPATFFAEPPSSALGSIGTGAREFFRDQAVPAGIITFTIFEMALYSFRHHLPGSAHAGVAGRVDLPPALRRNFEEASHLLDEAERILHKHAKAIAREVPATRRKQLAEVLEDLRTAMDAEPFEPRRFEEAAGAAERNVEDELARWRKGELREYIESIGAAVLVALLLRAVVVEAFKIPSGSMLPTLQINDHIFVNKFVYGPTVPFTKTRIAADLPPARGDVIVFEYPDPDLANARQDFIKRVIAIPGDVLEVEGGHPIINGWTVPSCLVGPYRFSDGSEISGPASGDLFVEFLGERAYLTVYDSAGHTGHQGPYTVSDGEVWVLGDNRHQSSDSRAWNNRRGGGVPFANMKGRAMFVWLPLGRALVNVMGHPELPKGAPRDLLGGIERCLSQRPPTSQTTPPSR